MDGIKQWRSSGKSLSDGVSDCAGCRKGLRKQTRMSTKCKKSQRTPPENTVREKAQEVLEERR